MTENPKSKGSWFSSRVLIFGLLAVIIVMGFALVVLAIVQPTAQNSGEVEKPNALAQSTNDCVVCHKRSTPGIIDQYGHSTMAAAEVSCQDCHEVTDDYPGAVEHEGTFVLGSPSAAMCQACHEVEVAQFNMSRHGLPAYVAYAGTDGMETELLQQYQSIPEITAPDRARNALYKLEGPEITKFACESCHNVGKPAADGSIGECQKCHLRHEFSLEQARKPETCNACHIGPDHPQWEIYQESPHGIAYMTGGDDWNWDAEPGTLTTEDFPAPTCAICHFSGFGGTGTTHDVGERLTWFLFDSVSDHRPGWQENMTRMQLVCGECHNEKFVSQFYTDADAATIKVNDWVYESRDVIKPLQDKNLLTAEPFDEPIDFTFFNLWHHWGRTAKFGVWMQGPDYTQWHGAYEVLHDLAELREMVEEKLSEEGSEH